MLWCSLRCALKPSASATSAFSKLYQHFRVRGHPYGLQDSLSTLRPSCSPCFHGSAMGARLATGGWLALTRQGRSPCKRRQALLGAITLGSGAAGSGSEARADAVQPSPAAGCSAEALPREAERMKNRRSVLWCARIAVHLSSGLQVVLTRWSANHGLALPASPPIEDRWATTPVGIFT